MKKHPHKTKILAIAGLLTAFFMTHAVCFSQNKGTENKTAVVKKQPRTALFMDASMKVNRKFDKFFEKPDPKVATWMGLFPGLGQIYNKKYWKLPIVYAGFGVLGYFGFSNRNYYIDYREAYNCKIELGEDCDNPLAQRYSADDLQSIRDYYRRNMELSFIFAGVWYILQVLDATVDAHLYYWEVDDETTLSVQPVINPAAFSGKNTGFMPAQGGQKTYNGFTVSLKF